MQALGSQHPSRSVIGSGFIMRAVTMIVSVTITDTRTT